MLRGIHWARFIATQSSDRTLRIYKRKKKEKRFCAFNTVQRFSVCGEAFKGAYHDETVKTFFRRLSFSPDGSLLVSVCGCVEGETRTNSVFIQPRGKLSEQPAMFIRELGKAAVVVRFSPVYYKTDPEKESEFLSLPYVLVFAIATEEAVYIYRTDQIEPVTQISGIHYTALTDLAWSADGEILLVSSTDGFVTSVLMEGCFGMSVDSKESCIDSVKERLNIKTKESTEEPADISYEEQKEKINILIPMLQTFNKTSYGHAAPERENREAQGI